MSDKFETGTNHSKIDNLTCTPNGSSISQLEHAGLSSEELHKKVVAEVREEFRNTTPTQTALDSRYRSPGVEKLSPNRISVVESEEIEQNSINRVRREFSDAQGHLLPRDQIEAKIDEELARLSKVSDMFGHSEESKKERLDAYRSRYNKILLAE